MNLLARPATAPTVSPTLLVVTTDRFKNLRRLRKTLEAHGCNLVLATSRDEAVRLNEQISFDGFVIDMMDEDSAGFELAHELKADAAGRRRPVVVLTSAPGHGAKDTERRQEALQLLSKAVDPLTLAHEIRRLTEI
jgi:CheY-like chemotaxis protein